ncbi:TPR domain protein [Fusarium tjaetaba]|uniref:TPR domain protein n=1 Tax=Fusarium tjaetaba TaxID=1567544 RepID=A0A8H5QQN2_9HYPO|nr:TPR domain protein [Fusarium tjaetaba]KAF5619109.1 TPR domain protein [Fusarium tjaetaba]
MDIKDVSNESKYIGYLKQLQGAAERAARRKGQAVRDHPPAQQLVSSFLMKLMAASYGPRMEENTIATTQVPAPYPPCIHSANDLEPIMISDMRLETHHRGKKVMLRVLTPPDRMTAVMAIVEDEKGIAVLLQLYHQPEETVVPATEILCLNMVCTLKEPFFKCATDGTYSLRVDHPSDIIRLDAADDRIPSHWRPSMVISSENSTDIRKQGNDAVKAKKWAEALRLYSSAIGAGQNFEERQLAFLNRSLANLNMDRPKQALLDAERATNPGMPSEKCLFRKARALYELGDYQQSLEVLETLTQSFPENKAASYEKDRLSERLNEQRTGEYKFRQMYKQAEKTPPLIDCATFSAPVEIRQSPGRGKGLFTTKAVSAGELLLCEKAFSYSFAGDEQSTKQIKILMNLATKRMVMGGPARLLSLVVQKLFHNSSLSAEFGDLHHADYQKATVSETDGTPVVDSFLVERITSLNCFGAPRTSRESFFQATSSSRDMTGDKHFKHTTSGIWLIASRINHSCVGNCRRSFIGDMQIVRATRDLPADTELFFCYRPPVRFETYQEALKGLNHWGFTCGCELCLLKKATSSSVLQRRKVLTDDLQRLLDRSDSDSGAKASRLMKALEKTYPRNNDCAIRLELWEPYFAFGAHLLKNNQLNFAANMILKGLEALGHSIIACPPDDITDRPRLEVQRWGLANDAVPWSFSNLAYVYRQLAPELCLAAEHYAEIYYAMVVGEKETWPEVLSSSS